MASTVDVPFLWVPELSSVSATSFPHLTTVNSIQNQQQLNYQSLLYSPSMNHTGNVYSIIVYSLIARGTTCPKTRCTVICLHSCYLTMGLHVTILRREDEEKNQKKNE
jgi:hypothetical protein